MGLQHHRSATHDFSAFAPLMAFGTHAVKATRRSRQGLGLGKDTLAGDFPGAIGIRDQPVLPAAIGDPPRISKGLAGEQVLLEQGPHLLDASLIQRGDKAGQSGARGQELAAKQGHKLVGKRHQTLVKGLQGLVHRKGHSR